MKLVEPDTRTDHVQFYAGSAVTMTNIAAAFTEAFGGSNRRQGANLLGRKRARAISGGGVNGNAGAVMEVQYSTDGGTNFATLCSVSIASHTATNVPGAWTAIPDAAKTDVILRAGTSGGDAAADPSFGHIALELE